VSSLLKISVNENKTIGSNGKLTAGLFESAGVAVAPVGLVPHQPYNTLSKAEVLRQGREGMAQLSRGNDWSSWKKVLPVLDITRSAAMLESNSNQTQGRRYSDAFNKWFRLHPEFEVLAKLNKGTRARFFECLAELEAIDNWRATLPPEQQLKLNYPTTVLTHWRKRDAPATPPKKTKKQSPAPSTPSLADIWSKSSPKEKREVLDHEGRTGLAEIVPSSVLAELGDHALALQINAASCPNMDSKNSTDVRVTLTKILRQAVDATTPDASSTAWAALKRKCEANNLDFRDLLLTFSKKRAPKKR
jgi:hypothetical protein